MKKDIIIPEVENVFMAVVQEWSDEFMEKVWYAYLVNDSDLLSKCLFSLGIDGDGMSLF